MVSVATQDARSEDPEMVLKSRTLSISKPGVKGQGKERKNQCQRKQGYREESTVGRLFYFKCPKEQKWRMQITLVGII